MRRDDSPYTIEEAYRKVHKLLCQLAHSHSRTTGMDYDDCIGEAHLAFLRAYETFHPDGGRTFSAWVYKLVSNRLIEVGHKHKRRRMRSLPADARAASRFSIGKLMGEVSRDARLLLECILTPPADVVVDCLTKSKTGLGQARVLREVVREYLTAIGWDDGRVERAFNEVREALA